MIDTNLKYCVYKTSHILGFYYIGKGITSKVLKGTYKGSGNKLKAIWKVNKYPKSEWISEILFTSNNEKEAYEQEGIYCTYETIACPFCLNKIPGGRCYYTYKAFCKWLKS